MPACRSRRCIPGVMHTNLLLDMVLYVYIKIRTSLFDANSRCTRAHLFVERKVAKVDESVNLSLILSFQTKCPYGPRVD